jgi:predicted ATPase/class 3 adenylate cyclase/DNA-binding SARP family transcriptional activator
MTPSSGIVTILFTDLVGSTELLARRGDETAQRIFSAHHELLAEASAAHGGQEIKWLGDGLMVAFASAADALRCALAMQRAAGRPVHGEALAIRVGLNAGETLLEEADYFGLSVVVARRLCDRAEPGQILCTDVVVGLLVGRPGFGFTDLGRLALKGVPHPVSVFDVRAASGAAPSGHLEIGVLGPVVVFGDNEAPMPLRSPLQRLLLAVLASRSGRVVPADELVEALWGDVLPAQPSAALQSQVFRLRRQLGQAGNWVETHGAGYRLTCDPERIDAGHFERLVTRARDQAVPQETLRLVESALALWRGRAYLEVAEHPALRAEAIRLEDLRVEAAEQRAELLTTLGRAAEAARAMEDLADQQPLRERPVALRMRALARDGRQVEALRVFDLFRRHLAEELGLEPSPELRAVEGEILRPPAPAGPLTPSVALPNNSFVGRDAELDAISTRLQQARLVTLTGPGGVGKTRLALHLAARNADRYPDGIYVCELAKLTAPEAVGAAVASTLRVEERAGRSVTERVVEFLQAKRVLLIIDNAEHVLTGAAELIGAVVSRTPYVAVLVTSRQRLGVDGEQRLPVGPLPTPAGDDLAGPAVVLFADRAAAVRPDLVLTADNLAAICRLCRHLEGLPLAIELAAARTVSRSPAEILAEIAERLGHLSDRRRPVDRHRSIDAVVCWSYDLLEPAEQEIFESLAVFVGGFTADAAAVVASSAGDVLDGMTSLVEHSLLDAADVGGRTRFTMLEPIRQYASTRLQERGRLDDTRAGHAAWFVHWVQRADAGLRGPDEASWAKLVDQELANLRAAHRWCLEHDPDGAVRMVAALFLSAGWYGPAEVFAWADQTVDRCAATGHPQLAGAFATAAMGAWRNGDLTRARALAERGASLAPSDHPGTVYAWRALRDTELIAGNVERALACSDQVIAHAHRAGDTTLEAYGFADRAMALGYAGNLDQAQAELAAALALLRSSDNPTCQAFCHYIAGEMRLETAPGEALPFLRRSRDAARRTGNRFLAGIAGLSALSCAARLGDTDDTMAGYADLIDYWHRTGAWTQLWTTIRTLVETLTGLGHDAAAAVLHGALTATTTASPILGGDADRMARATARLRERLGDDRFSQLQGDGAALGDERAVAYALSTVQTTPGVTGTEGAASPRDAVGG